MAKQIQAIIATLEYAKFTAKDIYIYFQDAYDPIDHCQPQTPTLKRRNPGEGVCLTLHH